jgi:hypothetical protein
MDSEDDFMSGMSSEEDNVLQDESDDDDVSGDGEPYLKHINHTISSAADQSFSRFWF